MLRVTGAWPVCLFKNNGGLPLCLEKCPACDKREVLPLHAFAECPATLCICEEAAEILGLPARGPGQRLVAFLLREHLDKRVTLCCQKVVGTSLRTRVQQVVRLKDIGIFAGGEGLGVSFVIWFFVFAMQRAYLQSDYATMSSERPASLRSITLQKWRLGFAAFLSEPASFGALAGSSCGAD